MHDLVFSQFLPWFMEHWRDGVEILILWFLVYQAYKLLKYTRALRVLFGLLVILVALRASIALELDVISWLLKSILAFSAIALVVLFQPELRRGLAKLGTTSMLKIFVNPVDEMAIHALSSIAKTLGNRRFGALIAIQRQDSLSEYLDTGVELDCKLSPEIMLSIFNPKAALHDGGVIFRIQDDRIQGAGCVFPLSQKDLLNRSIGLRHRAAIGITEESDAIAIVVSEETGHLSLAVDGELELNLNPDELRERLQELFPTSRKPQLTEFDHEDVSAS